MMKIYFLLLFSFLCSSDEALLTIENRSYSIHDFFSRYPKKQWERADSLQKERLFDDFINRELCVLEAGRLGFQNSPEISVKIYNRSLQILVNESYEHFVAMPLIPTEDIVLARNNATREVFVSHILVGHLGSRLGRPPQRTLDDALILSQQIKNDFTAGVDFAVLAEKYSDDPGVKRTFGEVGWIGWGSTVPEFQSSAFSLDLGDLSSPVLSDFGYHLILVSDERPSAFKDMGAAAYESLIINIAKNSIRDQLRPAAIEYDKNMIEEYGLVFNMEAVSAISKSYLRYQKDGVASGASSSSFLETIDRPKLVCVYNKKGYGPRWFARRLDRTPSSRQPVLETEETIISTFKTLILQDIAIRKGFVGGVDSSFSYMRKVEELVSGLLYDAYLKYLVDLVSKPDSSLVKDYYAANKNEKYVEDEKIKIREIRVSSRDLGDSLLLLIGSGYDFASLVQQYSSVYAVSDDIEDPFTRAQNTKSFDVAALLKEGEISPVVSISNNSFSIIQLVERFPSKPLDLALVYARIESLLIKEGQDVSKKKGTANLLNKYNVNINASLLYDN